MEDSLQRLQVDGTLDVRGQEPSACYLKTRETLDRMGEGQILEISVDEGDVLRTLPYAIRADGHELLVSEPALGSVRFLVRKRSALFAEEDL